jgi:hypothetical protein
MNLTEMIELQEDEANDQLTRVAI